MLLLLIYFDADACSNKFIRPCECVFLYVSVLASLSVCVCFSLQFISFLSLRIFHSFYLSLLRHTCTYFISKIELHIHTIQRVLKYIKCYTFNIACLKHICWCVKKRTHSLRQTQVCMCACGWGRKEAIHLNSHIYVTENDGRTV